jgi:hypothetical protein
MQNGQKAMNTHRPKSSRPFANRSKQWTSNVTRSQPRGAQNAQRSHERYLALAQAQAQAGEYRRGGKLLPVRGALFQIDVLGSGNDLGVEVRLTWGRSSANPLGNLPGCSSRGYPGVT